MTRSSPSAPALDACWVCGSGNTFPWKQRNLRRELRSEDLRITDDRYGLTLGLRRCRRCGFIFAEAQDLKDLTILYQQLADSDYEQSQDSRTRQMRWLLKKIFCILPAAKTLLDVGAGAGLLVRVAKEMGLEAIGVEPSRALVESASRLNGVELLQGLFPHPKLAHRQFDIVCLVDVIEHVADPIRLLSDCRAALAPNGILVVVTPDVGSMAARCLGQDWWHFRLAHVGYFDRRSLGYAARRSGLAMLDSFRARWFFRVSYLAKRLARYLPIGYLNRLAERFAPLRWIYGRVVRVNPHDSMVVLLQSHTHGP